MPIRPLLLMQLRQPQRNKMKTHIPATILAGLMLAGCGPSDAPADKGSSTSAASATADPTPVAAPSADIGKMVFRRCLSCHTIEAGGSNGIGPNLHDVVNRPIGSLAGFSYSNAMQTKGGVWDEAALDQYLEQPMKAMPGTRMAFAGIIDAADRKSIYLYLQANSPTASGQ